MKSPFSYGLDPLFRLGHGFYVAIINQQAKSPMEIYEIPIFLWIRSTISTGPWLLCRYHKSASKIPMEIYGNHHFPMD